MEFVGSPRQRKVLIKDETKTRRVHEITSPRISKNPQSMHENWPPGKEMITQHI